MKEWAGARVLVIGLARSGEAVARFLARSGADVTVTDLKPREELGDEARRLEELGIEVIAGGHPPALFDTTYDFVVKNPGVPYSSLPVAEALRRGIPVYTEPEIAWRARPDRWIGITGTNGKTTTTTWTGHMLAKAGISRRVAGNIGLPLCDALDGLAEGEWLVAELSSFQLMGTERFRPRIGAVLNVYPAHLDYHGTFEAYIEAKKRLFACQREDDWAVLNAGQRDAFRFDCGLQSRIAWFGGVGDGRRAGLFVREGYVWWRENGEDRRVCSLRDLALPGAHNVENFLAAGTVAILAGAPPEAVAAAADFRGVEHRLEFVRRWRGIDFYNDSKATNPEAACRALGAFSRGVVWIAGGLDRGDDYRRLLPLLRGGRVKCVVAMGQSAPRIARLAEEAGLPVRRAADVEEAVRKAIDWAREGDVVLLSPASASWDQYRSFEERGRMFKEAVNKL